MRPICGHAILGNRRIHSRMYTLKLTSRKGLSLQPLQLCCLRPPFEPFSCQPWWLRPSQTHPSLKNLAESKLQTRQIMRFVTSCFLLQFRNTWNGKHDWVQRNPWKDPIKTTTTTTVTNNNKISKECQRLKVRIMTKKQPLCNSFDMSVSFRQMLRLRVQIQTVQCACCSNMQLHGHVQISL